MAGETTEGTGNADMSLSEITAAIKQIMPAIAQIGEIQKSLAGLTTAEAAEDKTPPAAAEAPPAAGGEGGEGTPAGTAMDEAAFVKRIAARDKLAGQLSVIVGAFDHAEKPFDEVVAYGCEKLGIKAEKGQEAATLTGYLLAKPTRTPAATVALDAAATPKAGSFVAKHLSHKEG